MFISSVFCTWKWRWGSDEFPEFPQRPKNCPCFTQSPSFTLMECCLKCAKKRYSLFADFTITVFPGVGFFNLRHCVVQDKDQNGDQETFHLFVFVFNRSSGTSFSKAYPLLPVSAMADFLALITPRLYFVPLEKSAPCFRGASSFPHGLLQIPTSHKT